MIFSWPVLRYFTLENFGNWPAIADFVFRFFQLHRRLVSWWGALKLVYFLGVLWDAFFILVSFFGAARFLAATLFATFFFARELDFLASITVATLPKTALTTVVLAALAVAAAVAAASATSPANHLASSAALLPAATTVSCTLVIMGFFASIAVATLSKTTPAAAVLAALSALAPSAALFPAATIAPCALVLIPLLSLPLQHGCRRATFPYRLKLAHPANVRFGSKADIPQRNRDVRFTPESGHGCLVSAGTVSATAWSPGGASVAESEGGQRDVARPFLSGLRERLMAPDLVATFIDAFQ